MTVPTALALIGDIGATNARFALLAPSGEQSVVRTYSVDDFASLADAIEAYLTDEGSAIKPARAALAVASPISGDRVTLTNHAWTFSIEALKRRLSFSELDVINDFAATALALPRLAPHDVVQIGSGAPTRDAPCGIIGPGTGLGVSALVPSPKGPIAVAGEGGHITMAAATAAEAAVLEIMRRRYNHASAERVLSGPGLVNLYTALCELAGVPAAPFTPAQITSERIWREDRRAEEATQMFCAMLGTVAGNLALTLGAQAGLYLAGGIVPRILPFFKQSEFRARFEAKGRFRDYLSAIPTYVIVRALPGLLGVSSLLNPSG
ncbi:MAG TPA: glucokinase [Xanthobacteraceae bacterium]|nr:glucokinase [Xanthobacteraceae bacterium]